MRITILACRQLEQLNLELIRANIFQIQDASSEMTHYKANQCYEIKIKGTNIDCEVSKVGQHL